MNYEGLTATGADMSAVSPSFDAVTRCRCHENDTLIGSSVNYLPVYYISYDDIVKYFLPRLNQITGKNYRLPTEAEWEYAARGGQVDEYTRTQGVSGIHYKYSGSNTLNNVAWYYGNSEQRAHLVGSKQANVLGIYDMSGNVYEWCSDWYDDNHLSRVVTNPTGPTLGLGRVIRGGYCYSKEVHCTIYDRTYLSRTYVVGFRLCHSME